MDRRGFTIVELVIFIAIFSLVIVGIITVFITVVRVWSRQSSANEVETQGQVLLQQIQYVVQTSRLIDMTQDVASGTLTLRESASSTYPDPTLITLASGTVYLEPGPGASQYGGPQPLTSNRVTVSGLSFTRHFNLNNSSTPYGKESVSFSFTMSENTSSSPQQYSQTFQSSATILAPVPKIALIQQAQGVQNGGHSTSVAATYPLFNESSSLLIAVVTNTTSSATSSISDTAGNSWTMVASTSFNAYNQKLTVYDAPNAKKGTSTNEVFAHFGTSVGSPAIFIYEYRGASTTSPFDASSTQNQSSTASMSSGFASPNSGVELLLSVLYCNPSTGPVYAGPGFTIESSSSLVSIFIEDSSVYVSSPVAGTWAYAGTSPSTTSSSVILATFR